MFDHVVIQTNHKNPIKDRWQEPSQGRQKEKAKERPKDAQPVETKNNFKKKGKTKGES